MRYTLQRQNTERGLSPNFHIHALCAIYIFPPSVCLFCWRKYVDRSWDYLNRSQTHDMNVEIGAEAALFPEKEYINGIAVAVQGLMASAVLIYVWPVFTVNLLRCTSKTQFRKFEQMFPEKELHGFSRNFHIHVSVNDLYIPRIRLPILLQENMWTNPGNI